MTRMIRSETELTEVNASTDLGVPAEGREGAYVNTDASELGHTIHPEPANAGTENRGSLCQLHLL